MKIFKPEDFIGVRSVDYVYPEEASDIANKKLNDLIKSWPVIYGCKNKWTWTDEKNDEVDTYKARLAFIEEINTEPCKHEPYVDISVNKENLKMFLSVDGCRANPNSFGCRKCGVELQATWSEKK